MVFGWKLWEGPPQEAADFFTWQPWLEQLEAFPESVEALPTPGTDGILDIEGSVSAVVEVEGSCLQFQMELP